MRLHICALIGACFTVAMVALHGWTFATLTPDQVICLAVAEFILVAVLVILSSSRVTAYREAKKIRRARQGFTR